MLSKPLEALNQWLFKILLTKILIFWRSFQKNRQNSPGRRPNGVLGPPPQSLLFFFIDFFDNWPPAWGPRNPRTVTSQNLWAGSMAFFGPWGSNVFFFIDFGTFRNYTEKSHFFWTFRNRAKCCFWSNSWCPGTVFPSKSMTFGIPFGIHFSTFFKNGESVK